jgi:hypothetical protein
VVDVEIVHETKMASVVKIGHETVNEFVVEIFHDMVQTVVVEAGLGTGMTEMGLRAKGFQDS